MYGANWLGGIPSRVPPVAGLRLTVHKDSPHARHGSFGWNDHDAR